MSMGGFSSCPGLHGYDCEIFSRDRSDCRICGDDFRGDDFRGGDCRNDGDDCEICGDVAGETHAYAVGDAADFCAWANDGLG